MNIPKLEITQKKYKEESTVVSIRLPKDMLKEIDEVSKATGRSRNEIMTIALEFALEHIEVSMDQQRG